MQPSFIRVKAEILPHNSCYNEHTGQCDWLFHFRGLDMAAQSSTVYFEVPGEELGNLQDFFKGSALIENIGFIYN